LNFLKNSDYRRNSNITHEIAIFIIFPNISRKSNPCEELSVQIIPQSCHFSALFASKVMGARMACLRRSTQRINMTETTSSQLGLHVRLNTDFETAIQRVIDALKEEGFGVLTEIDVKATLKKKIDVDFRPYKILGACNPQLAHKALTADAQVGLLLPCNVVVSQEDDGFIKISIIDPISMLGIVNIPEVEPVAIEARARLERVAKSLEN